MRNKQFSGAFEKNVKSPAHRETRVRKMPVWLKAGIPAVCLVLIIGIGISAAVKFRGAHPGEETGPSEPDNRPTAGDYVGLWRVDSVSAEQLSYSRTSATKRELSLLMDISALTSDIPGYDVLKDPCLLLAGEYFTSLVSFDYESHFSLFPAPLVEKKIIREFEKIGISYEQGVKKINSVASEVYGFGECHISYRPAGLVEWNSRTDAAAFGQELQGYTGWFENDCEITIGEIEAIRIYHFEDMTVDFGAGIVSTMALDYSDLRFYRYRSEWHLWPSLIENDMSIDLVQADKDGILKTETVSGTIASINDGYITLLDNPEGAFDGFENNGASDKIYFVRNTENLSVGMQTEITYYRMTEMRLETLNGSIYELIGVQSVTPQQD